MTLAEPEIGAFIAALARVGGLAATAPVIGDTGVPMRARLVFVARGRVRGRCEPRRPRRMRDAAGDRRARARGRARHRRSPRAS